jgi:ParB-like chromosome segregation protein Spo0J
MKIEVIDIKGIKANPNNPRVIKDDKFRKLVKSIQEFPEMLKIRPIVVNSEMMVLGGNQRLKACKEAGLTQIPIIKADELTEEQQKEFIVKDNSNFGDWNFDELLEQFDADLLSE